MGFSNNCEVEQLYSRYSISINSVKELDDSFGDVIEITNQYRRIYEFILEIINKDESDEKKQFELASYYNGIEKSILPNRYSYIQLSDDIYRTIYREGKIIKQLPKGAQEKMKLILDSMYQEQKISMVLDEFDRNITIVIGVLEQARYSIEKYPQRGYYSFLEKNTEVLYDKDWGLKYLCENGLYIINELEEIYNEMDKIVKTVNSYSGDKE